MGIADYQITIFVAIVVVIFLFGRVGMFIAVVTILVWTFSMVFTKSLMTTQVGTIIGATITGYILRQLGGYGLLIAAIIGIGVIISNSSNNSPTSKIVNDNSNITNNSQSSIQPQKSNQLRGNPKCNKLTWPMSSTICPKGEQPYIP